MIYGHLLFQGTEFEYIVHIFFGNATVLFYSMAYIQTLTQDES